MNELYRLHLHQASLPSITGIWTGDSLANIMTGEGLALVWEGNGIKRAERWLQRGNTLRNN